MFPVLHTEPVTTVAITPSLPEAMEHNSTVVLTCNAKGSYLKFAWLMGTKAIVADGKRITLKEVGLHHGCINITGYGDGGGALKKA